MGSGGRAQGKGPTGMGMWGQGSCGAQWEWGQQHGAVLAHGWGPESCVQRRSVVPDSCPGSPCQQLAGSQGRALPVGASARQAANPAAPCATGSMAPAVRTDPGPCPLACSQCKMGAGTHPAVTGGHCRVKSPKVTGEGAAGSMVPGPGKNRQHWLTVGVSKQRGCWCWAFATQFPWCLHPPPCPITCLGTPGMYQALAGGRWTCRGPPTLGTTLNTPGITDPHEVPYALPAHPARLCRGCRLSLSSIQKLHDMQGGVPRVRGTYSATFP